MRRLLYLVGTGYSGSTLLSFLMNAHPDVVSVGEATGPYELVEDQRSYPCSCGATLSECEFWKRVGEAMKARGFDFGPNRWDTAFRVSEGRVGYQLLNQPLRSNSLDAMRDALVLRRPAWRARLEHLARRNEALIDSALEVSGKRVFFDASKGAARARYFHRLTDVDLKVVQLVRDPLGFVSSWTHRGNSLLSGVRYWMRTVGHARRLAALLPEDRFLRVRYEDVCRDMDGELTRLATFAGVAPRPGPVDFRAANHHMIGSEMRLADSGQVKLDERWRERLTDAQVRQILRWTGRRRKALGYD